VENDNDSNGGKVIGGLEQQLHVFVFENIFSTF
jgi:hypothetical protein